MKHRYAKKDRETHTKRHPILDEFAIKGYQLRNKAVVAPMSRVSANGNGVPTVNMTRYYAQYASGGFGLVITEGTYTDRYFSLGYANQFTSMNEIAGRASHCSIARSYGVRR